MGSDEGADIPTFFVLCFSYATDGVVFGAKERIFEIKWYDGLKEITGLPIYPIKFSKIASNETGMRQYFIERGMQTIQIARGSGVVQHKRYNGPALSSGVREELSKSALMVLRLPR